MKIETNQNQRDKLVGLNITDGKPSSPEYLILQVHAKHVLSQMLTKALVQKASGRSIYDAKSSVRITVWFQAPNNNNNNKTEKEVYNYFPVKFS